MFAFRFLYDNLKFAECMLLIVRMNACFYNSIFLLHASQHLPKGTSFISYHYHLNVNTFNVRFIRQMVNITTDIF